MKALLASLDRPRSAAARTADPNSVVTASRKAVLCFAAATTLVLLGWSLSLGARQASAQANHSAAKTTVITVTAGKPSELAFKLSKKSAIPSGKIIFKVTNLGQLSHTFKICRSRVTSDKANSCTGVATRTLNPGQSASLTVILTAKGKYEFGATACTGPTATA